MGKYLQNGLTSFGAFIALSNKVNGWLVLGLIILLWEYEKED